MTKIQVSKHAAHSDAKKIKAVKLWLECGSPRQVAEKMKMSEAMINSWKNSPWWKEVAKELVTSQKVQAIERLRKLYGTALDKVDEALTEGNAQYDQKTGKIIRVPVSAKDASSIAKDMVFNQVLLEKEVRQMEENEKTEATVDILKKLAEQFAAYATKQNTIIDVEDAEIIEVNEDKN